MDRCLVEKKGCYSTCLNTIVQIPVILIIDRSRLMMNRPFSIRVPVDFLCRSFFLSSFFFRLLLILFLAYFSCSFVTSFFVVGASFLLLIFFFSLHLPDERPRTRIHRWPGLPWMILGCSPHRPTCIENKKWRSTVRCGTCDKCRCIYSTVGLCLTQYIFCRSYSPYYPGCDI